MTACPKMNAVRDPAYRRSARDRMCDVPGCEDTETVVLAHIRSGNAGTGIKPPDDESFFLCHQHHDEFDGRSVGLDHISHRAMWVLQKIVIPLRKENYRLWKAER